MSELSLHSSIHISKDTVSRRVKNQEVLLNMATGQYFGLNESGTLIWEKLKAGQNLESAAASLVEEFDVSTSKARTDVLNLVEGLQRCGLVELE